MLQSKKTRLRCRGTMSATIDGGVYELTISGGVRETGAFELRKK